MHVLLPAQILRVPRPIVVRFEDGGRGVVGAKGGGGGRVAGWAEAAGGVEGVGEAGF